MNGDEARGQLKLAGIDGVLDAACSLVGDDTGVVVAIAHPALEPTAATRAEVSVSEEQLLSVAR